MNLSINKITENKFEVKIYGNSVTVHQVIISDDIYLRLTNSKISKEKLLEFSFAFLLERESNASILTSFDLQVISKYFSNYEHEVRSFIDTL